ncbi:TnsA endonuclease-like protein [Paenibacillus sp. BK033]|uniref:TnsA endonuclease N-terminal domain-containing protein n=1 Tax=Paenibacillus sp. BK033 TaxID=2512133 RepID=UPI0010E7B788|nr:TnsA endonuclease N-terminal domain-containing protein [Paenibacillus sp. BK033]TCM99386.1 TnsA endonuclease-like protein [Paenibacillus sp. BK033]
MIPIRKIRPTKGRNYRSKISRSKNLQIVHAESLLERDFVRLCNFDKAITNIYFQPVGIRFFYQGRERKYFPDYLLKTIDDTFVLVEVKLKEFAGKDKNKAKFLAAAEFCKTKGWKFNVVTEDQIRPGYLQYNLKMLLEVKVHKEVPLVTQFLLTIIKQKGRMKVGDLFELSRSINPSLLLINLYKLIYSGCIVTDLIKTKVTNESILTLREDNHESL